MTDRERNTIRYHNIDITVEPDVESASGISFLIRDGSTPGNSYYTFAYFDSAKLFVDCNCIWDEYEKAEKSEVNSQII